MRSLTVLLGLILLTACKQFSLSEDDKKILAESDLLMEEQIKMSEKTIYSWVYGMNTNVQGQGNRPADVEVLEQSFEAIRKFKHYDNLLKTSIPIDSIQSIELNNHLTSYYNDEMKQMMSYPFREFNFYNQTHLRLELSWNLDRIIDYLRSRTGVCTLFDPVELMLIEKNQTTEFYLLMKQRGNIISKITLPEALKDSIQIQNLQSSTTLEFSKANTVFIDFYDERGDLQSTEINEIVAIQIMNQ